MNLAGICSQCGKYSKSPHSCNMCGSIVGDCCFVSKHGICRICATKTRTQGI